jgi:hypothetical protein
MPFQFCCPQGHVLQGDLSQVGQLMQCPMCGSGFLIPPPDVGPAAAGSFFQVPGTWPAAPAGPSYPAQGPIPGMMPPQPMPMMPSGATPLPPFPTQPPQPFAFGPTAAPAGPAETLQQPPAPEPQGETVKPRFDLGFDPSAKEALPFDLPSDSGSGSEPAPAAPLPPPSLPTPSFLAPSFPPPSFPGAGYPPPNVPAQMPPATVLLPSSGGPDFLQSAPEVTDQSTPPPQPPTILHIRCPSGHLVNAQSDLLGQKGRCPACKKTFELRYEDSVEFQRRTEKILRRQEIKTGNAWTAWAFLLAFLAFAGLVALMLALSR